MATLLSGSDDNWLQAITDRLTAGSGVRLFAIPPRPPDSRAPIAGQAQDQLKEMSVFDFNDLKRLLVERVGLEEDQIVDDPSTAFTDLGMESLGFVELMLAIQQELGFTIPEEDAQEIHTIGETIAYANRRLAEVGKA